jgi:hypothetical protein
MRNKQDHNEAFTIERMFCRLEDYRRFATRD